MLCLDLSLHQIVTFTVQAGAETMSFEIKQKTAEHRLIEAIKGWAGDHYIGDDCAILPHQQLLTSDTLVEGTHFVTPLISWLDLGWKTLAVNLSDIAAMAGRPRFALISLTLPAHVEHRQLREFYAGLIDCAGAYRTEVVGGDLTRGALMVVTATVLGEAHANGCLRRSGANPGDVVAVSGDFGASAAGLWALQSGAGGYQLVKQRHCRPLPLLTESWGLIEKTGGGGALMDASDGLADALVQIAAASAVGMEIDVAAVPVVEETRQAAAAAGVDSLEWALYGGEDYALVACIPPAAWQTMIESGDPFTAIGVVNQSGTITLNNSGGLGPEIDLGRSFQHWENVL